MDVKQNASPARHEDPTVPSTPASGRENKRPIDDQVRCERYEYCVVRVLEAVLVTATSHAHLPTHPRHVRLHLHHRQPSVFIFLAAARHVFPRTLAMSDSQPQPLPPSPGIYVPAVLFFRENEDIDEDAIKSHIVHLAQARTLDFLLHTPSLIAIYRGQSQGLLFRDRTEKRNTSQARSGNVSFV